MSNEMGNFEVPVTSITDAPGLTFHFRGDTVHAELAGAKIYGEAEGDDRTRLRLTDASGEVLADITVHPRAHRDATENAIDVGGALLWSHWRWAQASKPAPLGWPEEGPALRASTIMRPHAFQLEDGSWAAAHAMEGDSPSPWVKSERGAAASLPDGRIVELKPSEVGLTWRVIGEFTTGIDAMSEAAERGKEQG